MKDEIIIIVKRDDEYHKFIFDTHLSCSDCSLLDHSDTVCDICMAVDGCFRKVVTNEEHE